MLVCSPMRFQLSAHTLSVYIPVRRLQDRIIKRLTALAKKRDRSVNCLVMQAITEFLDREERQA